MSSLDDPKVADDEALAPFEFPPAAREKFVPFADDFLDLAGVLTDDERMIRATACARARRVSCAKRTERRERERERER